MQVSSVDRSPNWRPQGADLYSTGASGAVPVRQPHAVNAVESTDRLGEGVVLRTSQKSETPETESRDWTMNDAQKQAEATKPEKTEEPPKEPIYRQLLDFIESMWRGSAMVVELAEKMNKTVPTERISAPIPNESVTYSDPKVKRTGGAQ
jgi:hypothetical protein